MALYTNRNLGAYSSGTSTIYQLKDWLTSGHGGTQHWSTVMSGDGLSAYSASGNVITSASSGANGLDNTGAWFVLQDPDANREILVQRGSNDYDWLLLYSPAAGFSGGDASTAATASDQQGWTDGSGASASTLFPKSGNWMTHICAEGDSAEGNVWTFWCISRVQTSGNPGGIILCDAVIDWNSPSEDSDKAVFLSTSDNALDKTTDAAISRATSTLFRAFTNYGGSLQSWSHIRIPLYFYLVGITETLFAPENGVVNPETSQYPLLPVFYITDNANQAGRPKGESLLLRINPNSAITFGDTAYDKAAYYLVADDLCLKGWPDSTGPTL